MERTPNKAALANMDLKDLRNLKTLIDAEYRLREKARKQATPEEALTVSLLLSGVYST